MAARPRAAKLQELKPIDEKDLPGWKAFINKSIKVVERGNKVQFELILLTAELEKKYGESRLERWAEAIGIAARTARQYKSLNSRGVDAEFIEKWQSLGFARIRCVLDYCGRASNPAAQHWLQYAMDNSSVSRDALYGRMVDVDTQNVRNREQLTGDYKLALAQKADAEKMKPEMRSLLEQFGEIYPDMRDQVLETVFLSKDGKKELEKLEELAGVKSIEWERRQRELKSMARKIKLMQRWWAENLDRYIDTIQSNEADTSYEIASNFDLLLKTMAKAMNVKPTNWHVDPDLSDIVNINDARKKKDG